MKLIRRLSALRRQQILGHAEPHLDDGEHVVKWARAREPGSRRSGFVYLTERRIVVVWPGRKREDAVFRWDGIASWTTRWWRKGGPVVRIQGRGEKIEFQMPVETRGMAQNASEVLDEIGGRAPASPSTEVPANAVERERRSFTEHTRRLAVTILGIVLIVVGLVLSAPGVPGPGLLVVVAGLGVLATEYDWAKDLQHWAMDKARKAGKRLKRRRRGDAREDAR